MKSSVLQVISLARLAIIYSRSWAADSPSARVRLKAQLEKARSEIRLLEEELRIKDARMGLLDSHRRPHYRPAERLAIVELRAARGWSCALTARRFLVEPGTIAEWVGRLDEQGPSALVQTPEPVNLFPECVRYMVRRLKVLCPSMGKKRMAQTLARAGLQLGVTTVARMLKEKEDRRTPERSVVSREASCPVKAEYSNHAWQVDLIVVPTAAGLWAPWFPFALVQVLPFCWWVACVVDQFSRQATGYTLFRKEPESREIRAFLGRVMGTTGAVPKYLVSDKGPQFSCDKFKVWCKRRGIEPRYASTGGHVRATAVIERFIRSLKDEWLRRTSIPLRRDAMRKHLSTHLAWYHESKPNQGLGGRTPNEVALGGKPANKRARIEPRTRWPADSPCAGPWARPSKRKMARLSLVVRLHGGRLPQLPVVDISRAA